jgi:hypothetical protein
MIKTYDEALKTLNDIRTYLAIGKADDCVQELDKVARYFINEKHKENPFLSECIKEWEERGFTFKKRGLLVEIESKEWNVNIHIWMDDNELLISNYEENYYTIIPYDLVYLLSKTLKALEVEDEYSKIYDKKD